MKICKSSPLFFWTIFIFLVFFQTNAWAKTPVFHIDIQNHLFIPSEITIPANTKIKLIIHNKDVEDEEFESYELNREKVIIGKNKGIVFIGPLPVGTYPFFGEFFPKTAQGVVTVIPESNKE